MEKSTFCYLDLLNITEGIIVAHKNNDFVIVDELITKRNARYFELVNAETANSVALEDKELLLKIITLNEELIKNISLERDDLIQQLKAMQLAKKCNKIYSDN